ncbi:hypothetical protein OAD36_04005 [Gammaproteobacteria bacterium]|nr:hypothetical protein [Gammaproteobacteria bacterium]MDC0090850.1 hypothetical protein [Gammaproteobacteria bacterium]
MDLSELFNELNDLLWALGLITGSVSFLLLMPKKYSLKLGEYPLLLASLFGLIIFAIIQIYS